MRKGQLFRGQLSYDKATMLNAKGERYELGNVGVKMGNATRKLSVEQFNRMTSSFGLFGGGNNANVPTPDMVAADILPKPEDFIVQPFRCLSATIVGAGSWKATDFTDEPMLKASAPKLNAKTIYFDHDQETLNWVGLVDSPVWEERSEQDGLLVPAGINADFMIDAKTNYKIARGVLLGSIYSNSVTVDYAWEASHMFDNLWEFYDKIGQMHEDGTMIRRICREIEDYYETSLVWLGADPFAKKIGPDGKKVNIETGAIQYNKENPECKTYEKEKRIQVNVGIDKNLLSLSKQRTTLNTSSHSQNPNDMTWLEKLRAKMGLAADVQITDAMIEALQLAKQPTAEEAAAATATTAFIGSLKMVDANNAVVAFTLPEVKEGSQFIVMPAALHTATFGTEGTLAKLREEKTALEADAKAGKDFVELKRAECIRLYKVAVGGEEKADAAVLNLMKNAKTEELEGLLKLHTDKTGMQFGGRCKDCGSGNFEFKSSYGGGTEDKNTVVVDDSPEDLRSVFDKPSMHIGIKRD